VTPKNNVLDILDNIVEQIEKICPFGSMVKLMYKFDNPNSTKDIWFTPNREEVETRMNFPPNLYKIDHFKAIYPFCKINFQI
jgi:hypothetical protein